MHIGLPASFQALPTQVPVPEATMRAELNNSALPERGHLYGNAERSSQST